MPQAHSSPLKNPGQESPWSEKEAGFNLLFLNGAPEENLPPPPVSAVPIQLDLLTRSQRAQQKETGLYVRGYDSFTNEVSRIVGVRKGSINFTGEKHMHHPAQLEYLREKVGRE